MEKEDNRLLPTCSHTNDLAWHLRLDRHRGPDQSPRKNQNNPCQNVSNSAEMTSPPLSCLFVLCRTGASHFSYKVSILVPHPCDYVCQFCRPRPASFNNPHRCVVSIFSSPLILGNYAAGLQVSISNAPFHPYALFSQFLKHPQNRFTIIPH